MHSDSDIEEEGNPLQLKPIDLKNYQLKNKVYDCDSEKFYLVTQKGVTKKYIAEFREFYGDMIQMKTFFREVEILTKISSSYFLQFIGYNLKGFEENSYPTILYNYEFNTTLNEVIKKERNGISPVEWSETKKLINIYGIASGMALLHSKGIIHRNLKPGVIYLDNDFYPKIGNLSLAIQLEDLANEKVDHMQGTPLFLAPEILNDQKYSKASDVYAFAITVYELISLSEPYQDKFNLNMFRLMKYVTSGNRPKLDDYIPECYKNLITRCWAQDPKDRPTFDEIVSLLKTDEFITNLIDEKEYFDYIENSKNVLASEKEEEEEEKEDENPLKIEQMDLSNFKSDKKIDKNSSAKFYIYIDEKTNQNYLAKIPLLRNKKKEISIYFNEIEILTELSSTLILKFIGYNLKGIKNKPTIIFEYAPNGSLNSLMNKNKSNPNEWTKTKQLIAIYGIAAGMAYIHSKNIILRNLKLDSIYFDDYLLPKITNFIYSIHEKDLNNNDKIIGTILYLAPEIIKDRKYSKSSDVYSFAMILYKIITGKNPFDTIKNPNQLCEMVLQNKRPSIDSSIPECYKNLIEKCWAQDPEKRPTFNDIVSLLKTKKEFITDQIDEKEYLYFIDFIGNQESKPKFYSKIIHIEYINELELKVDSDPINLSEYETIDLIGEGAFGEVYKIKDKKGKFFAAIINKKKLTKCDPQAIMRISREINILSKLNSLSILKYIGYSEIDFNKKSKPTIVTEYSSNKSLDKIFELIDRSLKPDNWTETKSLITIYGIAYGMAYLHSMNILHRDLKPANIFLDEHLYPKIGDFGLSKKTNEINYSHDPSGSPAYMAPEIIRDMKYLKAGDVYAFSIILYQIITFEKPYKNIYVTQLFYEVLNGLRPKFHYEIPKCYRNLIEQCWSDDPKKRPTFDEIVNVLETDGRFITSEINKSEYKKYIKYLKNKKPNVSLPKFEINYEELEKIQKNDTSINVSYLNLEEFEKQELIRRIDLYKIYKIKNKITNNIYEAKISNIRITKLGPKEFIHLSREINILSKIDHPTFLKFIGFNLTDFNQQPYPVIITEIPPNQSLAHLLKIERSGEHIDEWDDTKKLIVIYGIAAGMAYLHSNKIIHRNLNPKSIFLDDYLFPKIGNFGLLTKIHSLETMTYQTTIGIKGDIQYSSPELLEYKKYSKKNDVYSFALIVYEIVTLNVPFEENKNDFNKLFNDIVKKSLRPQLDDSIPKYYRQLIEFCWSQNPDERPSFEDIANVLKNEPGFITDKIDKNVFRQYVEYIEKSKIEFYSKNKVVNFDDIISKNINNKEEIQSEFESSSLDQETDEESSSEKSSYEKTSYEQNDKDNKKEIDEIHNKKIMVKNKNEYLYSSENDEEKIKIDENSSINKIDETKRKICEKEKINENDECDDTTLNKISQNKDNNQNKIGMDINKVNTAYLQSDDIFDEASIIKEKKNRADNNQKKKIDKKEKVKITSEINLNKNETNTKNNKRKDEIKQINKRKNDSFDDYDDINDKPKSKKHIDNEKIKTTKNKSKVKEETNNKSKNSIKKSKNDIKKQKEDIDEYDETSEKKRKIKSSPKNNSNETTFKKTTKRKINDSDDDKIIKPRKYSTNTKNKYIETVLKKRKNQTNKSKNSSDDYDSYNDFKTKAKTKKKIYDSDYSKDYYDDINEKIKPKHKNNIHKHIEEFTSSDDYDNNINLKPKCKKESKQRTKNVIFYKKEKIKTNTKEFDKISPKNKEKHQAKKKNNFNDSDRNDDEINNKSKSCTKNTVYNCKRKPSTISKTRDKYDEIEMKNRIKNKKNDNEIKSKNKTKNIKKKITNYSYSTDEYENDKSSIKNTTKSTKKSNRNIDDYYSYYYDSYDDSNKKSQIKSKTTKDTRIKNDKKNNKNDRMNIKSRNKSVEPSIKSTTKRKSKSYVYNNIKHKESTKKETIKSNKKFDNKKSKMSIKSDDDYYYDSYYYYSEDETTKPKSKSKNKTKISTKKNINNNDYNINIEKKKGNSKSISKNTSHHNTNNNDYTNIKKEKSKNNETSTKKEKKCRTEKENDSNNERYKSKKSNTAKSKKELNKEPARSKSVNYETNKSFSNAKAKNKIKAIKPKSKKRYDTSEYYYSDY